MEAADTLGLPFHEHVHQTALGVVLVLSKCVDDVADEGARCDLLWAIDSLRALAAEAKRGPAEPDLAQPLP